MRIGIILVGIQ